VYYNVKKAFTKKTCEKNCEKKGKEMSEVNKEKMSTKFNRVILASSSVIRIEMLNKYFENVKKVSHRIDEEKFKTPGKKPEVIALTIAKKKALSVLDDFDDDMIVASDQILVCENKIISKPKTLEAAKKKLLFLRNKTHKLYSSIYVVQKQKFYFQQVKEASLFFANLSQRDIESYVMANMKTVMNTVGSYKIEENFRYKFIRIIKGDLETIKGFPLKDLIEKIRHEK
tara:strand:- start:71 stop:754 length:684 start_codon:yes stop_codon:yes gene_type:complete